MRLWPTPPRLVACFLIVALLSLADTITAQTTSSGGLTGVVTDQSNAVVRNAEVDINNNARGVTQSTKTSCRNLPFLLPYARQIHTHGQA
jgi:hypothetical protein